MTAEIRQDHFADIPDHQSGKTSSIGGLWPPEIASFERVKAVYTPSVVEDEDELRDFLGEFHSQRLELDNNPNNRVQFRAVLTRQALNKHMQHLYGHLEVAIPLGETAFRDNLVLVYLGANGSHRQPDPDDLNIVKTNLEEAKKVERKPLGEIFERVHNNNCRLEILQLSEDELEYENQVDQMTALYERFGWNRDEVVELLQNPDNIISVAKHEGRIVSAGIAEIASIPIGNESLRIAEITEAATLEEFGGNGFYTGVSAKLLEELARRSKENSIYNGPIDLVFGECNGLSLGVLKAVKAQGRMFAAEVAGDLGFQGSGILYQQVPIEGVDKKTTHNDLLPAYLTREMLIQYYG